MEKFIQKDSKTQIRRGINYPFFFFVPRSHEILGFQDVYEPELTDVVDNVSGYYERGVDLEIRMVHLG
jgi:hypothetical protein